jgi:hypothetical protein
MPEKPLAQSTTKGANASTHSGGMACTSSQLLVLTHLALRCIRLARQRSQGSHPYLHLLTSCRHSCASMSLHPADPSVWSSPPGAVMASAEDYLRQLPILNGEINEL